MNGEELLKRYGIKPTAVRLLVLRGIMGFVTPFSFEELYEYLETVDRSTVFRTVILFEKQRLLSGFNDGLGKRKYCLNQQSCGCENHDHDHHHDHNDDHHFHVHVTCRVCGRTYCLPSQQIPKVEMPDDFDAESVSYVITGVCGDCKRKGRDK